MHELLHPVLISASLLAALGTARGQSYVVSPTGYDILEGTASNNYPWMSGAKHYMQIHSDLKGVPRLIKGLAWRRDGTATTGTGTRTVDMELWLGHTVDHNQASFLYAKNYTSPSQQCLTRQNVNIGPVTSTTTLPPFEVAVPLGTPFLYLGVGSLAWEVAVYGNVLNGAFPASCDAAQGVTASSSVTVVGTGCIVSGKTSAMLLATQAADNGGVFALATALTNAPSNQPAVIAVGSMNPSLTVPGLCSPLYTDLLATLSMGVTDANGFIGAGGTTGTAGGGGVFLFPNIFGGALLFVQAHALDPLASGIQLANSDGRSFTAPTPNLTRVIQMTRLFSNDVNPTQPAALFTATGTMSYGLVTQFAY